MSGLGLTGANYGAGTGGGGLITSSTPGTGPAIPLKSGIGVPSSRTEATEAKLIANYGAMSNILRKSLSQQLKSAGYKVPVTGNYNATVREAFLDASRNLSSEISMLQANDPQRLNTQKIDLTSYLKDIAYTRTGMDSTGGKSATVQTKISTPLEGRELINRVFEDILGRGATKAEFDKYFTQVTKRQKAMPITTTYSGGAKNVVNQTSGPDVEEFLFQKIAGTDEAKSRKVFGFYDIFKQALGVD